MESKELRIGNWLLDGFGKYYQAEVADLVLLASRPDTKECNPVLLTPEILEKAGFIANNVGAGFVSMEYRILINTTGDSFYLRNYFEGGFIWGFNNGIEIGTPKTVKFTHQLQNLYFALTGSELPINL